MLAIPPMMKDDANDGNCEIEMTTKTLEMVVIIAILFVIMVDQSADHHQRKEISMDDMQLLCY